MYFTTFHGYIVTCNKDGSIPLNSRAVCQYYGASDEGKLLDILIRQANYGQDVGEAQSQASV